MSRVLVMRPCSCRRPGIIWCNVSDETEGAVVTDGPCVVADDTLSDKRLAGNPGSRAMNESETAGSGRHRALAELQDAVRAALSGAAGNNEARDQEAGGLPPLIRVAQACSALLPVDGASISVMAGTQHRETLYASDPVIARVEDLQFSLGEGPCYEAFQTGQPVLVADLDNTAGQAWPVFASQIIDQPVGAIFAFPLAVGAARVGAIDMYRAAPGPLRPDDLATALQVADLATIALLGSTALHDPALHDTPGQGATDAVPDRSAEEWFGLLAGAKSPRAEVHQATGMLVSAHNIDVGQALALLRGYAFSAGRLVDQVAADLVNRRLSPEDIGP